MSFMRGEKARLGGWRCASQSGWRGMIREPGSSEATAVFLNLHAALDSAEYQDGRGDARIRMYCAILSTGTPYEYFATLMTGRGPQSDLFLATRVGYRLLSWPQPSNHAHAAPRSARFSLSGQAYPQHPCEDPAQLYLWPSSVAYPSRPPPRTTPSLHDARATSQLRDMEKQLYLSRGLPGWGRRVHTTTTSPVQRNAVPSVTSLRAWSSRSSSRAATIAGPRTCRAACLAPLGLNHEPRSRHQRPPGRTHHEGCSTKSILGVQPTTIFRLLYAMTARRARLQSRPTHKDAASAYVVLVRRNLLRRPRRRSDEYFRLSFASPRPPPPPYSSPASPSPSPPPPPPPPACTTHRPHLVLVARAGNVEDAARAMRSRLGPHDVGAPSAVISWLILVWKLAPGYVDGPSRRIDHGLVGGVAVSEVGVTGRMGLWVDVPGLVVAEKEDFDDGSPQRTKNKAQRPQGAFRHTAFVTPALILFDSRHHCAPLDTTSPNDGVPPCGPRAALRVLRYRGRRPGMRSTADERAQILRRARRARGLDRAPNKNQAEVCVLLPASRAGGAGIGAGGAGRRVAGAGGREGAAEAVCADEGGACAGGDTAAGGMDGEGSGRRRHVELGRNSSVSLNTTSNISVETGSVQRERRQEHERERDRARQQQREREQQQQRKREAEWERLRRERVQAQRAERETQSRAEYLKHPLGRCAAFDATVFSTNKPNSFAHIPWPVFARPDGTIHIEDITAQNVRDFYNPSQ
ncbi:hypothetical protein C8J57DRAFT_1241490 [Mycena rebaudengoi]|nr:hypothetical protein C8J57DRAFT_1241490 [Mycena rebaudengoi]